jgi:hypothetical protein
MKDISQRDQKRATAYMSFGASPNICPGRHFASGEILSLVAMMVLRYEIIPESRHWVSPPLNTKAMAASITPPGDRFSVNIRRRQEYQQAKWEYKVTEGKGRFGLVVG